MWGALCGFTLSLEGSISRLPQDLVGNGKDQPITLAETQGRERSEKGQVYGEGP